MTSIEIWWLPSRRTLTGEVKNGRPSKNENFPFHGTFDGGGHTIRGLHISQSREGGYGLFGAIDGTVKNLTILGTMTCLADDLYSAVGGIAGILEGQSNVICCIHNGIADGQWQDTDFPAVGDIIRQMDTEKEHIPQMEQC